MSSGFVTDRDGTWIEKGPGENLLYKADVSKWLLEGSDPGPLTGGTVTSSTLTVASVSVKTNSIEFNLSGGTLGTKHVVTITWVTAKNPVASRSFTVRIVNR